MGYATPPVCTTVPIRVTMDILALVEAKGVDWARKSSDEISIVCPNSSTHQGGADSRPSFNINLDGKGAHCFACGFKLSPTALLKWLMGEDLDDMTMQIMTIQAKIKRLKQGSESDYAQSIELFMPPGTPWEEDGFRGISLDTYTELGALHVTRGRYTDRIVFPITVNGEFKGVDARDLVGNHPKYLRNKNSSCRHDWLYPYDLVKANNPKHLIIGEGLFHAVNGIDKGFDVLCIFGANNWSLNKLRMIIALGAEEVTYFKDPDKAGTQVEQWVCSHLSDWVPVTTADVSGLGPKEDLGDLTKDQIQAALDNRHAPLIPACMPESHNITFGAPCRTRTCPFCKYGKCLNIAWAKEVT